MITNRQYRRLKKLMQTERKLGIAAAKSKMDEKTARKYLKLNKPPEDLQKEHNWKTRKDPFESVWPEIEEKLKSAPGLEAKTLFEYITEKYPDHFKAGQLRTLQRKIKQWRALEGAPREVFFPQERKPGELCESDFTCMNSLGITIGKQPFDHLIYHFVLPYSNWETGSICFSESYESLGEGLQDALWELGGSPFAHLSDRLSAAVQKPQSAEEFTDRYAALLRHYNMEGRKTQAASPNENGDVEQRHYRLKRTLDQQLLLRGTRDFGSREEYEQFLRKVFERMNLLRKDKLDEEIKVLRKLPLKRFDSCKRLVDVPVSKTSTIRVNHNIYSVDSRLIGEKVTVYLHSDRLEVFYAQKCIEKLPRLYGENKYRINYRHLIDWLMRKPGAFANYKYREDMFPTTFFRSYYDDLIRRHSQKKAAREYLKVLYLAAKTSEDIVDKALQCWLFTSEITKASEIEEWVKDCIAGGYKISRTECNITPVNLKDYDELLA